MTKRDPYIYTHIYDFGRRIRVEKRVRVRKTMRQANVTGWALPLSSRRQRPRSTAGLSANYKEVIASTARNVYLYIMNGR